MGISFKVDFECSKRIAIVIRLVSKVFYLITNVDEMHTKFNFIQYIGIQFELIDMVFKLT